MQRDDNAPWVRFFNNDEMLETLDMNLEERGCYLVMRQRIVRSGGCLQDNDAKIARYLGVEPDKWMQLKPVMREIFTLADDGWSHPKWTEELNRAKARIDQTRRAGQMGGRAKSSNGTRKSPSVRYHLELELDPDLELEQDLNQKNKILSGNLDADGLVIRDTGDAGTTAGNDPRNVVMFQGAPSVEDDDLLSKEDYGKRIFQIFSAHGKAPPSNYWNLTYDEACRMATEERRWNTRINRLNAERKARRAAKSGAGP